MFLVSSNKRQKWSTCLLFLSADGLINNRFTSFAHVSIDANVIKACCFASSLARNPYIHGQLPQSCETHSYVRCAAGLEISRILFILGKAPDHHHHHRRIGRLAGTRRCWKISQIWRLAEHALFHSLGFYFLPSELFALYILKVFYTPFWQFLINVPFFFNHYCPSSQCVCTFVEAFVWKWKADGKQQTLSSQGNGSIAQAGEYRQSDSAEKRALDSEATATTLLTCVRCGKVRAVKVTAK